MAVVTLASSSTPVASTPLSPVDSIIPYTKGLTGVNLWLNDVDGFVLETVASLDYIC